MDVINSARFDLTVMKEPRGFLRVIQFVLSIFAFATVCSSVTTTVILHCTGTTVITTTVEIEYAYPFDMRDYPVDAPFCGATQSPGTPFQNLASFSAAAQFFCFMGVMSFLLCIAYCVVYIFFGSLFAKDSTGASVDFIFAIVWVVLWFIGSTAWADNLAKMTSTLNPTRIIATDLNTTQYCIAPNASCEAGEIGSTATLVVSVLFGYLNMLIWGAGLWFLYKETRWHRDPESDTQNFGEPTPAATGGDGTYQAPDKSGSTIY